MQRTNEIVALKEISTHTPMGVWKNEMSLPHLTGVMYAVGEENVWKIRNQLHDTRGNTAGDRQSRAIAPNWRANLSDIDIFIMCL